MRCGFMRCGEVAAAELEHVGDVSLLEKQFAGELVVLLVEGAAGNEDLDALRIHAVWRGGHTVPSWHKLRLVQARYSEINPMRGMRWLLLVVIAAVLCGVVLTYLTKKKAIQAQVLPTPQPLPPEIAATSEQVVWTQKDQNTGCLTVKILADTMSEQKDSGRDDLVGAKLYIYHKCEDKYDIVESAAASYYPSEKRLFSEGEVRISLGERADSETPASLAEITSSGVTFDTETGHADDRKSTRLNSSHLG